MLIKYRPTRITLHHNLLLLGQQRNPQISREGDAAARETTVDMRNNVVWNWGFGYGRFVMFGPWVNVVGNYYENPAGSEASGGGAGDRRESSDAAQLSGAEEIRGGARPTTRAYFHGPLHGGLGCSSSWLPPEEPSHTHRPRKAVTSLALGSGQIICSRQGR
jgi:hypothetical protein